MLDLLGDIDVLVITDLSLAIARGETMGLVGESGSGKSSIANAVLGLVPASSGTIQSGPVELTAMRTHDTPWIRSRLQAVFQDPSSSLDPSISVEDIVTELLRAHRP